MECDDQQDRHSAQGFDISSNFADTIRNRAGAGGGDYPDRETPRHCGVRLMHDNSIAPPPRAYPTRVFYHVCCAATYNIAPTSFVGLFLHLPFLPFPYFQCLSAGVRNDVQRNVVGT
jgi:hypothetical protein